jgi:hypothetical protein
VAPGDSPGGLVVAGNYTQTPAGILDIEIAGLTAGTGYDQLHVFGDAFLDGTLDVDLVNGFTPTADAFFDILLTGFLGPGSVTGTFATVHLPTSSTGMWDIQYLSDRVRIDFDFNESGPPPAVPQAPSLLLTFAGLGVLALIRHLGRRVFPL